MHLHVHVLVSWLCTYVISDTRTRPSGEIAARLYVAMMAPLLLGVVSMPRVNVPKAEAA